jgi:hypothetical protein
MGLRRYNPFRSGFPYCSQSAAAALPSPITPATPGLCGEAEITNANPGTSTIVHPMVQLNSIVWAVLATAEAGITISACAAGVGQFVVTSSGPMTGVRKIKYGIINPGRVTP